MRSFLRKDRSDAEILALRRDLWQMRLHDVICYWKVYASFFFGSIFKYEQFERYVSYIAVGLIPLWSYDLWQGQLSSLFAYAWA